MLRKEQNARAEASATVSAVKKEYHEKQSELQTSIDAANKRERQAQKLIDEQNALIDALAESKVTNTKNSLKKRYDELIEKQTDSHNQKMDELEDLYKEKVGLLFGLTLGGVLYSLFATLLTAVNSQRFSNDIHSVCELLEGFYSLLQEIAYALSSAAWSLKEVIPYPVINTIIPGLLAVLGYLIIFLGFMGIVSYGFCKVLEFYADSFADTLSVVVALVSLALLVWFADYLTFIKCNLILVFLIIHAVYVILRIIYDLQSH